MRGGACAHTQKQRGRGRKRGERENALFVVAWDKGCHLGDRDLLIENVTNMVVLHTLSGVTVKWL